MAYNIISGDSHIDLRFMPEDVFLDNARPGMSHKMPKVVDTQDGRRWNAGGVDLGVVGQEVAKNTFSTEMSSRWQSMIDAGFFDQSDK